MAGRGESVERCAGAFALVIAAALAACDGGGAAPPPPAGPVPPAEEPVPPAPSPVPPVPGTGVETPPPGDPVPPPPTFPRPCADLYADDLLPTFEVDLSDADLASLREDLAQGEEVWYPAAFRYGDEIVPDAAVRLRGNNSRCGDKLQLAISFNRFDPAGRFHGLRRLDLDHGGCRILEERLALSWVRDLGLPAACANHARLVVNGVYEGVFANLEHVNKDFLRRNFGSALDDGNLYKSGTELRTNETNGDTSDLRAWEAASDPAALAALADLDEAALEWAAEAVLPARDNYWLFGWNYYLYHHPERGFLFLPTDLDQAFPGYLADAGEDTLLPDVLQRAAAIALADPAWRLRYEQAVRRAVDAYDEAELTERLDRWWAQIAAAVAEEPVQTYGAANQRSLANRVVARGEWLRAELDRRGW